MTENLTRVTAQIFAGNAQEQNVGQFGSALIGTKNTTTNIAEIQGLPAYTLGWSQAVLTNRNYPTLEEMNGVMRVMSYQTAYNMQKGMAEYDPNTTYYSGDMCKGIGTGIIYVSRVDNNLGNDPTTSSSFWAEYTGSSLNLPATNYIAEMGGNVTYSGNTLNLPAMTLYAADGRNADNTLKSASVSVPASSFNLTGEGKYTVFYNAAASNLLLAVNYAERTDVEPTIIFQNDVWYKLDNYMYFVDTIFPNYTASDGVSVSESGIVSNLGTLSLDTAWNVGTNPTFNVNFTTGDDVTTLQSLFRLPFATANIEDSKVNITLYGNTYGVTYYPTLYNGSYSLSESKLTYNYEIDNIGTIYANQPLTQGLTVYYDIDLESPVGQVTSLSPTNLTITDTEQVYDGEFSLVSSGSYYTYTFGDETNYYTSAPLAGGVVVYTDTELSSVYGTVASVTGTTVLIQQASEIYNGSYTQNETISLYTYTMGENTYYTGSQIGVGVSVYTDNTLEEEYATVQSLTTSNIVLQGLGQSNGYVAAGGSTNVAAGVNIYSDFNLTEQVDISSGNNATYTGVYQRSTIGQLSYDITASTVYNGSLVCNNNTYTLTLNNIGTSLISTRQPYSYTNTVTLGGSSTFLGTFNLNSVSIPNVWTWNGYYNSVPNWVQTQLVELGDVTILNGAITELNINQPIELAKISDIKNLADKDFINTNRLSDCVLSYIEPMSYVNNSSNAVITLPLDTKVLFADGVNSDYTVKSIPLATTDALTLTIDNYANSTNIIYLQYVNRTLSLQYTDSAYYFEQDTEPENATDSNIEYIWHAKGAINRWYSGNTVNGWTPLTAVKLGEFTGGTEQFITGLTVAPPVQIGTTSGDFVKRTGDTMSGALNNEYSSPEDGGNLTIESDKFNIIDTNYSLDDTSIPTAERKFGGFTVRDKNNDDIGGVRLYRNSSGQNAISTFIKSRIDGTEYTSYVRSYVYPNGELHVKTPTPLASSNSTDVATTAWVRTALSSTGGGLATFSKAANGYIKFNNGIIIQWGTDTGVGNITITFPISFTSTNYQIVRSYVTTNNTSNSMTPNENSTWSKSKTGFNTYNDFNGCSYIAIGY